MNKAYHYVVLRLATNDLRGEIINMGIVLFQEEVAPKVIMMATLNKVRAVDATWTAARLANWAAGVHTYATRDANPLKVIQTLAAFGLCDPDAVGMFTADTDTELARQLAEIKATYVANRAQADKPKREKKTRLQTALREQFKNMQVLGGSVDDVAMHLVVPNVPVPSCPELKSDFLYKNGVYRITQTLDYHVSPDSLHNKLSEACVKSTAAELALKTYGDKTIRLAVVDIPEEFADAADTHIDLLINQGFKIFHYGNSNDMARYLRMGAPAGAIC